MDSPLPRGYNGGANGRLKDSLGRRPMPQPEEKEGRVQREEVFGILGSTPDQVRQLVAGLSEQQLRFRPSPEEWSIKEVMAHLRDTTDLAQYRLRRILTEDNPLLPAFEPDKTARERNYMENPADQILPAFQERRRQLLEALRGLREADWQRTGVREGLGQMTLSEVVERMAEHDLNHLEQMRRVSGQLPGGR